MPRKKRSRLTSKKRAGDNGGGKRQLKPVDAEAPPEAECAGSSGSGASDSDDSDSRVKTAAKLSADASPRNSRRDTPPPMETSTAEPSITELERQLRKNQKLLREINALLHKPVEAMNADQQAKLLRYSEVQLEVEQLQAALAAAVEDPEDACSQAFASGDEEEAADTEAATAAAQYGSGAVWQQRMRDGSEASSSTSASNRLSLGSVVSAAAHEPSLYYEEPPPPTPEAPPPPLRRSDVAEGTSAGARTLCGLLQGWLLWWLRRLLCHAWRAEPAESCSAWPTGGGWSQGCERGIHPTRARRDAKAAARRGRHRERAVCRGWR